MNTVVLKDPVTKKYESRARIMKIICLVCAVSACLALVVKGAPAMIAFADATSAAENAVAIMIDVLCTICIILGAFFLLFGIVQTAIANADSQGARLNEGLTKAAVGLVLIVLGTSIIAGFSDEITSIITEAIS